MQTTMIFIVLLWFHYENRLVGNFHYYICNRHLKIRKYGEFDVNRTVHLFETASLMHFSSFFFFFFFFENLIFFEN